MKQELTPEFVREALDYDPATGLFVWKMRPLGHFKNEARQKHFNARFGNKPAGSIGSKGYLTIAICGNRPLCHRLAWLHFYGVMPTNLLDHINGEKSDNRISNLRESTHSTNAMNARLSPRNTSGVKGVQWNNEKKKWEARICASLKTKTLGRFSDINDAISCIRKARMLVHGSFANNG